MNEDFSKTILLNDDPAESDYFESHEPISTALDALIRNEKGKKSIALIGARGSGKSSIINFLRILFSANKKNDAQIFIFDAWSHSGDPLRRSFLEELIKFLREIKWIEEGKWQKELDVLCRKREDRSTKSEPVLTLAGKLIIGSTLLLPIGYTLFGLIDKNLPVVFFGYEIQLWILGVGLVLMPALIFLLTWLCWRPAWKFWTKEFWCTHRSPHDNDSLFWFFIQKVREVKTVTTISTPNPTTVEFQNLFKDLLKGVLDLEDGKKNTRKLVVVIDNLDRVDHDEAYAIWSTMRTFFDLWTGQTQKKWLEKFCLIAPFAPEFPQDIFDFEDSEAEHKQERNIKTGISFVEKTFQSIFYVPLPVLSKWKDYLIDELGNAFPVHKSIKPDVFHQIYRIYDIVKVQKDGPPTPRDLKLFINKVGSRNRIWGKRIDLAHQAVYVLYFDEIQKDHAFDFSKWSRIDKRILDMFDHEQLQRDLAALHFNVKADVALQALTGGKIRAALQTGNKDTLKMLSEHVTGFFTVLEREVADNCMSWSETEPNTIPMSASAMKVFSDRSAPEWNRIEEHLQNAAVKVTEWRSINDQVAEGLSIIIERAITKGTEGAVDNLIKNVSKTAPEQKADQGKTVSPKPTELIKQHVRGLILILKTLERIGQDRLKEKFRISGTERTYVQILMGLCSEPDCNSISQYFIPKAEGDKIVEDFVRICNEGQFSDIHAQSMRIAIKIGPQWPWQNLMSSLNTRLQAGNNLTPSEIIGCVLAFTYLVDGNVVSNSEQTFEELSNQGHLFHHLAAVSNDSKGFATCLVPLVFYNSTGQLAIRRPVGNSSSGLQEYKNYLANPSIKKDVISVFSDLLVKMGRLSAFLEKTRNVTEQHPLVSQVFNSVLCNENDYVHLPSVQFVKDYDYYRSRIESLLLKKHIEKLIQNDALMKELESFGFKESYASLYLEVLSKKDLCSEQANSFTNFLLNSLRQIQKDEWKKQLMSEGETLHLLTALSKQGETIELSQAYHDALLEHAHDVVNDKTYPVKFIADWIHVISALNGDWKETYLKNVRDKFFIEAENNKKTKILELYGSEYKNNQLLEDKSEDIVRRMLVHVIKRMDKNELFAIETLLKQKPSLFKEAPTTEQNVFKEVLQDTYSKEGLDGDVKNKLNDIAKTLSIEINQNKLAAEADKVPVE